MSLFMLPNVGARRELVEVLGHEAAIWCVGNRTFVLVAREPQPEVERMASFVQASLTAQRSRLAATRPAESYGDDMSIRWAIAAVGVWRWRC